MIYKFFKRLFDVICALLGIIGTSPIWIVSIILTEISDPGPLFYFANRVGKDNKKFKMWKFRSMRVVRGASEASLRPEQDRIFWWGKIMRRLKIDELPQLLNILNGTMSIVGPRPAAVDQIEITRGGENAIAATVPCGLTSQSSLWDYIYGDQFTEEEEYNEKSVTYPSETRCVLCEACELLVGHLSDLVDGIVYSLYYLRKISTVVA